MPTFVADTVSIAASVLALAFSDPGACRPPQASALTWARPLELMQAGPVVLTPGGGVAAIDLYEHRLRLFAPDGRPAGTFGARGSGPGEFGLRPTLTRWVGDSVAVTDPNNARIVVFAPDGQSRTISLAAVASRTRTPPTLALDGTSILFQHGTFIGQGVYPRFRAAYRLVRWSPGSGADEFAVLRDTMLSPEMKMTIVPDFAPVYGRTNLARRSFAEAAGNLIAVYDEARPELTFLDARGSVVRIVRLDVRDPVVTQADRDSVTERWRGMAPPPESYAASARRELLADRQWFPDTRAALLWRGTDADGGVWLSAYPPTARGGPVHIRVTSAGRVDRCFREAGPWRAVAFSRDRVALVQTLDEGDLVNVAPTVAFPGAPMK